MNKFSETAGSQLNAIDWGPPGQPRRPPRRRPEPLPPSGSSGGAARAPRLAKQSSEQWSAESEQIAEATDRADLLSYDGDSDFFF